MARKEGILLVAFGATFAKLARVAYADKSILEGYPVHVVTNRGLRSIFAGTGWTVTEIPHLPSSENREIRTQLHLYTPFDRTLHLDVDQLIPRPGVHRFFELPGQLVMTPIFRWRPGDKIIRLYKNSFQRLGAKLPITVWGGALMRFDKTADMVDLFRRWRFCWNADGRGRDMPGLAAAVQLWERAKPGRKVTPVPKGWHAGCMHRDDNSIIQHAWHDEADFCKTFGLPRWNPHRSYEGNIRHDWGWVDS
jgi:hypothetical protein